MKAILLTGLKQMKLADVPEPKIQKEIDVLLKIERVGICGSDVHYYETGRIGEQIVEYPFIIGHECSATVEAVGGSVTRVKAGDQVMVEPAAPCHKCDQCAQGRENTCHHVRFLGTPGQGGGCLCEYLVMPEENCFPTKGKITLEQAALCEPLSIGFYAVKKATLPENADVAVLGAGPIGLSCLLNAKAGNARACYVTDKIDERVEGAKKGGATWAGNPNKQDIVKEILQQKSLGVDAVFECAGQQEAIDQAVEILEPGGKLVIIGSPRTERVSFNISKIRRKEISIINIRRQNKCAQAALDLVASGKVNADFMITHHFPFEQTQKAFDLVAGYHDGVIKAMISV
ncbi:MAG TPA: alcohol dehydrogenase catalytic domain-containing protein [Sedimentisphaerales bacterium]|nr:alcohol dehydrogenase catalytic domain-containing protein [Sedimentisphaerales bacterium]